MIGETIGHYHITSVHVTFLLNFFDELRGARQ
jgi:hypothetical protein